MSAQNSPSLVKSRFRQVYGGLLILWIAGGVAIYGATTRVLHGEVLKARASYLSSLVRSQQKEIEVFRDRALRDELIKSEVIQSDQEFSLLVPAKNRDQLEALLDECSFLTPEVCLSSTFSLVLVGSTSKDPFLAASVVYLKTEALQSMGSLWIWMLVGILGLGIFALITGFGIRAQEKFFVEKIELLMSAIKQVHARLKTPEPNTSDTSKDEFDAVSQTVEQLGADLNDKIEQVDRYKKWLTRHTQREQLKETLEQSAHNLRAPLEEGLVFFESLQEFNFDMPKDKFSKSIVTLVKRFEDGIEALESAMSSTSKKVDKKEAIFIGEIFGELEIGFNEYFHSSSFKTFVDVDPDLGSKQIYASSGALMSVFWNLARNSFEAKADGTINFSIEESGAFISIRISDNGPGIRHLSSDEVFSEFITSKTQGTGLGMSSVKRVIEDHEGNIDLIKSDFGAVFKIELPLMPSNNRSKGLANV